MRFVLFLFLVLFCFKSEAQIYRGVYFETGLNRIGVPLEFGAFFEVKTHNFNIGARFYGPDLVFEKNYPGLNLNYGYAFRTNKKMEILLGASVSGFYESKGPTKLWLFDPKLKVDCRWKLQKHYYINLAGGFGSVLNRVETSYPSNMNTFTYLNYELALRFTYYFGANPND